MRQLIDNRVKLLDGHQMHHSKAFLNELIVVRHVLVLVVLDVTMVNFVHSNPVLPKVYIKIKGRICLIARTAALSAHTFILYYYIFNYNM